MEDTLVENKSKLNGKKLGLLASELINNTAFTPNPEDPNPPPWPWRHVLNKAYDRMLSGISARVNPFIIAALNPQPLPPRLHFSMALAQEVVERAGMMKEFADAVNDNAEQQGIIIVGGYLNKFVDEICPTPPIIKFPKRVGPWPPDPDPHPEWTGLELAVIGTHFLNEARHTDNRGMQKVLNVTGEKLLEAASERMY